MSSYLNQLFKLATEAHQKKSHSNAQNIYRQILREFPDHPDALHLMGLSLSEEGKEESAIRYILKAIEKAPNNVAFYSNLGEVYRRFGKFQLAEEHFTKAITLDSNFFEAKMNLANLWQQLGKINDAISLYKEITHKQPQHARAWFKLGCAFINNGQYKSAIEALQNTIRINPQHFEAHNNLGIALLEWDRYEEAMQHYKAALHINPNFEHARQNLGLLYETIGDIENARLCYKSKLNYRQRKWDALLLEKTLLPKIVKSNESVDAFRAELLTYLEQLELNQLNPGDIAGLAESEISSLSQLIYQGRDDKKIKQAYSRIFLPAIPEFSIPPKMNTEMHLGFVVTSGHEGVFLKCMRGILNNLSNKFRVTVICNAPNGETILRPSIQNPAIEFLSLPASLTASVAMIQQAQCDLLYYWEVGTDKLNYLLPFFRLAKVQCTSWGWPTTSGIPNLDYFISAETLEPDGSELHYTEKLVKQKRLPVYYYRPPIPAVLKTRSELGLNETTNYYLCQQNLRKVHPDFDTIVRKIAEADPKACILFIHDKYKSISQLLINRLQQSCAEVFHQIQFIDRMSEEDYLQLLANVDVALDTLHYGGGANTCYDAFSLGTPLITLAGSSHKGRFAYAAFTQMDFTSCISKNLDDYCRLAVEIATDKSKQADLRNELIRKSASLFEDKEAVSELENTFEHLIFNTK